MTATTEMVKRLEMTFYANEKSIHIKSCKKSREFFLLPCGWTWQRSTFLEKELFHVHTTHKIIYMCACKAVSRSHTLLSINCLWHEILRVYTITIWDLYNANIAIHWPPTTLLKSFSRFYYKIKLLFLNEVKIVFNVSYGDVNNIKSSCWWLQI